jgi:hypothetical protein
MSSTLFGQFCDRYGQLIRRDLPSVKVYIIFLAAVGFDALLLGGHAAAPPGRWNSTALSMRNGYEGRCNELYFQGV